MRSLEKNPSKWRTLVESTVKLPYRIVGRATTVRKRGKYTIHLRPLGESMIDFDFKNFLHELGHIFLRHFEKENLNLGRKEVETDAWVVLNFRDEINTVNLCRTRLRATTLNQSQLIRKISKRKIELMIKEMGRDFILDKDKKASLKPWLDELIRTVEFYKKINF